MRQYNETNVKTFTVMPEGEYDLTVLSVEETFTKDGEKPLLKTTLTNGTDTILDHTLVEHADSIYEAFRVKNHSELNGKTAKLKVKNDGEYSNVVWPMMPLIGSFLVRIEGAEETKYNGVEQINLKLKVSGTNRTVFKTIRDNDWWDTELQHVYKGFEGIEDGNLILSSWLNKVGGAKLSKYINKNNGKIGQNIDFIPADGLPAWSEEKTISASQLSDYGTEPDDVF